ncbi:AraC family transcriptional regulator [Zobellella maritima]|uniref:AraC family transcriptional regulator n=1 Tax=Zobellella maritima TaxID=2059725 RepID=UPI000E308FE1|nr:AraC family transcriptional regulator [Zobellella maritima]
MNQHHNRVQRQFLAIELSSIGSARDWMGRICGPHNLEISRPQDLLFRHQGASLGQISFGVIEYSTPAHVKTQDLLHSYSISLPLTGSQYIEHKKNRIESNAQTGLIVSPGNPVSLTLGADCRKQLVRISRTAVEQKLASLLHRDISAPIIFDPGIRLNEGMGDWWSTVATLQGMLKNQSSLFDFPDVWSSFQDTLITGLLYAQPHNYSRELEDRQLNRPTYLTELESMMKAHLDQALSVNDFEKAAGVSREKLYRDFRTFYDCSPMAYFRNLRFQQVRIRLQQAAANESVSSIAMDCGFTQLGRFAKEYQQRFGELPSESFKGKH